MTKNGAVDKVEIGVIGLGNWGTALAQHFASSSFPVLAWSRNEKVVDSINNNNLNSSYLSDLELSPNLKATTDLESVCSKEVVIVAVPAKVLSKVVEKAPLSDSSIYVSAIKGMDPDTFQTPLSVLKSISSKNLKLAVISGPGFAKDIARNRPAGLVVASNDEKDAKMLAEIFSSDSLRVYTSKDTFGVELGGILKNIIAIAAGIVDGLDLGDSARAGIITRGLAEMTELAVAMGAQRETLFGLSGLGDLILTATCNASRNRRVGLGIGMGMTVDEVVDTIGSVAEGLNSTPIILKLAKEHGVEVPITEGVQLVLEGKIKPKDLIAKLILRPTKAE